MKTEAERSSRIDPAHPVAIQLGPLRFAIPWAYLLPRPFSTHLNCDPKKEWVGIQYWLPDFEAPERDLWFSPEFSPNEADKPKPGPHEVVIKVTEIRYYGPGFSLEKADTDDRIDNFLRMNDDPGNIEIIDGLTHIKHPTVGQWFSQEGNQSLVLWCDSLSDRQVCQGSLDLKDLRLAARFLFPIRAVSQHANIVAGVRALLGGWQQH